MQTALITGISGQDGWFLANQLLERGDRVVGLTRDVAAAAAEFAGLPRQPELLAFDYGSEGAIVDLVETIVPDAIYNLAAFATGQGMFDRPQQMARLNGTFVLDILEAIRNSRRRTAIAFVQASSSEMFGDVTEVPQSEATPLRPKSPYGAAKQYAHSLVGIYRRAFGVRASSAILYNHESVRRPPAFVTKKVARGAARISLGLETNLVLGALDISRDWGYAPEYMDALVRMASAPEGDDFVVATGRLSRIRDLVEIAFGRVGLDWERYVKIDSSWVRPIESVGFCGNPAKIEAMLDWKARTSIDKIICEMVDFELQRAASDRSFA